MARRFYVSTFGSGNGIRMYIYGEACVFLMRILYFMISVILANINLPRITARKFENSSLFQILRDHYRVEIKGGDQRIKAIPASQKISRFLKLKMDQPVLHLERKMETNKTGLFLYSSIFCNTEKYSIFGRF